MAPYSLSVITQGGQGPRTSDHHLPRASLCAHPRSPQQVPPLVCPLSSLSSATTWPHALWSISARLPHALSATPRHYKDHRAQSLSGCITPLTTNHQEPAMDSVSPSIPELTTTEVVALLLSLYAEGNPLNFGNETVIKCIFHICRQPEGTFRALGPDRKSTRLNSSHSGESRMPSSA